MKANLKTKNTLTNRTRQRSRSVSRAVVLAHATQPYLRHLKLVEPKHTGKLIRHCHTSHMTLVGLLLLVGVFLYVSASFAVVQAESSGTVSIGVIVPGPAPTVGATIITPTDGTNVTNQETIEVTGTCAPGTFVVLQNNNELAGSTVCTNAGIFVVRIQLQFGINIISALNYDNLNQPGPNTPLISVSVTTSTLLLPLRMEKLTLPVALPANPSIISGVTFENSSCSQDALGLPTGGTPRVAIVCVPRFVDLNMPYSLDVMAWGGLPPYALDIDWGDRTENSLLSIPTPSVKTVNWSYIDVGVYTIKLRLKDRDGKSAIVQTAIQTRGGTKTPLAVLRDDIVRTSWFKTPTPLYLIAVAVTLGFWGGDIFDRKFGARKHRSKPCSTA